MQNKMKSFWNLCTKHWAKKKKKGIVCARVASETEKCNFQKGKIIGLCGKTQTEISRTLYAAPANTTAAAAASTAQENNFQFSLFVYLHLFL